MSNYLQLVKQKLASLILYIPIKETHHRNIPFHPTNHTLFFLTKFRIPISLNHQENYSFSLQLLLHICMHINFSSHLFFKRSRLIPSISNLHPRERDECRLGASCCSSSVVHPLVTRAIIPAAFKDKSGGIWEHEHKWDRYSCSCCNIFLHIHHLDHCNWYPHTC